MREGKAAENGTYTLTVSAPLTSNRSLLTFNYLHLIDHMTGADVDLLQTPSYTFEGRTTDYTSRFTLVFVANEANLDGEDNDNFAFISNGELIVFGEGTLQVFDILGHQLYAKQLSTLNPQLSILTSPGVYVLRLIDGDDVKTQKIVVN